MENMERACHFQMEYLNELKIKKVTTKSFLSENIEPNSYTTKWFFS